MKKIISALIIASPLIAFAQTAPITDVNSLSTKILGIGSTITYILVALAVLFIVWNVVRYIIMGADPAAKSAAGLNVLWGIVGLFVIVSIWGLVNILTNTFATTPTNKPIPNFGNNTNNGGLPGNQLPVVR
jgi:hypothetical protein